MTGKAEQEPSIEEILASIRQIISDDDETRPAGDIGQPKEDKADIPLYQPEEDKAEPRQSFADVLELTNEIPAEEKVVKYEEEKKYEIPVYQPEPEKEIEVGFTDTEREPEADFRAAPEAEGDEAIFSRPAADATADAFSRLVSKMPIERNESRSAPSHGNVTLEDIARDLLRPMLRQWIDENVPRLVERLVEKELEKLSRKVRD